MVGVEVSSFLQLKQISTKITAVLRDVGRRWPYSTNPVRKVIPTLWKINIFAFISQSIFWGSLYLFSETLPWWTHILYYPDKTSSFCCLWPGALCSPCFEVCASTSFFLANHISNEMTALSSNFNDSYSWMIFSCTVIEVNNYHRRIILFINV